MLLFGPKNDVISKQKKRSSPKFQRFFRPKSSDLQKKKGFLRNCNGFSGRNQAVPVRLRWAFHFSMSFRFMDTLDTMGPGVIVPPALPLVGPAKVHITRLKFSSINKSYARTLRSGLR